MRVKFPVAALLAVASAVVFAQQSQNPFAGRWNLRGTGPDIDKVYWLEVTQKGDQLEGVSSIALRMRRRSPGYASKARNSSSATGAAKACRKVRSLNAGRFIARTWRTAS